MPSVETVAKDLVDLCRQGRNMDAIERYYADNIVSIEPVGNESMPARMTGKDAIRGKNQWWLDNHEVHRAGASDPMIGNGQFAVHYEFDVTNKPSGQRFTMTELALYTVKDGRIVEEQFFYHMPGA